ncbi:MAG: FG-GAP-like repeat-containing protein, partial [Myxococcota bacterium]
PPPQRPPDLWKALPSSGGAFVREGARRCQVLRTPPDRMLLALLACAPDAEPPGAETAFSPDTAVEDTAPDDPAEPMDTGPCPTDYVELEQPSACDGHVARDATSYPLSGAALRVSLPGAAERVHLDVAADLGDDGAPDLVVTPWWNIDDTFSVWVIDASRRGEATSEDAWFSLHWSRLDYGYTHAAATYAPGFFPEDALAVKAGENPAAWYTFRAPLLPGSELEDADLVVVGQAGSREDASNVGDAVPAGDLDGDGLSELLLPAPRASDGGTSGYSEEGRVYILPGGTTGVVTLDDLTDWVGGEGDAADCASWDISEAEALGDMDGDGHDDLAFAGSMAAGRASAWILRGPFEGGRRVTEAVARVEAESFYGRSMASGDFDGDGVPDLALTEDAPPIPGPDDGLEEAEIAAYVHYGPFDGVREAADGVGLLPTEHDSYVGVWMEPGDFDGDGFDDLLSIGHAENLALTWGPFCETGPVQDGAVSFETEPDYATPSYGLAAGADVDDDGLPDLAVRAYSPGVGYPSAVYLVLSGDLPTGEPGP